MRLSAVLLVALGAGTVVLGSENPEPPALSSRTALPPVTVIGNAFWAEEQRFYIRGIDYQPGGSANNSDPLADLAVCQRDIPKFKELGINSIRVYLADNTKNHDACMQALAAAGIYLLVDLNNPRYSINRAQPAPSYSAAYLQSVFATVDAFAPYDNTLVFFSGNEVVNDEFNTTAAAAFVKAVTRDVKTYIKARGYRTIPVGYSAADVSENRMQMADYMNCGPDDLRSDFFAFNDYSWCNTNFVTAGWDQKVKRFADYGIPIFLSEWGCVSNGRDFNELSALMSDQMTPVYSGGLLYEYSMESNGFGIVQIRGSEAVELAGFAKFKAALAKYPAPSGNGGAATTTHAVPCPTLGATWQVNPMLVPDMPADAQAYLTSGAGPGPGLDGPGSQQGNPGGDGKDGGDPSVQDTTSSPSPSPTAAHNDAGPIGDVDDRLRLIFLTLLGLWLLIL